MIRKLSSGEYRLYSRKPNPKTGKRRNLGTFKSRAAAEKHERAVQYFKRHSVYLALADCQVHPAICEPLRDPRPASFQAPLLRPSNR